MANILILSKNVHIKPKIILNVKIVFLKILILNSKMKKTLQTLKKSKILNPRKNKFLRKLINNLNYLYNFYQYVIIQKSYYLSTKLVQKHHKVKHEIN